MKKSVATIAVLLFTLLGGTAQAVDEAPSGEQLGLYIGGKIGMSNVRMSDRKFGMYAGEMDFGGYTIAADHQTLGMGGKNETVWGGGLTLGYDFDKRLDIPVRVELDYTIRDKASKSSTASGTWFYTMNGAPYSEDNTVDMKTSVQMQTLMVNAWFDIPTGTAVKPYLGGGIGWAFIDFSASAIENGNAATLVSIGTKSSTNFAWSLGGGLGYAITQNWTVDLGYRYINAGDIKEPLKDATGTSFFYGKIGRIETHDVMLGVRYTF
jgi:opacity protein-like surface antigen